MTVEIFRAMTPYLTVVLTIALCAVGYFLRRLVEDSRRSIEESRGNFEQLNRNLNQRISHMEGKISHLESSIHGVREWAIDKFVPTERFNYVQGENRALADKTFEELRHLAESLNQMIGTLNATRRREDDGRGH